MLMRWASWTGFVVTLACCFTAWSEVDGQEAVGPLVDVNLFASATLGADRSVMVGDRGKLFLSEDGARTWKQVESGTKSALAAVCFPNALQGWVVGQGGVILHSEDGGRTWAAQSAGVNAYFLDLDFLDPVHGVAVGAESTVLVTVDGGRTWKNASLSRSLDLDEEINLFGVAVMEPHKACVAGDRGRIFRTEDGGESWEEAESPLYDEEMMEGSILYSIAYDSGVLYAVGIDGVFVTSEDLGKTWKQGQTGFSGPELYSIDVVGGEGFAVGSGGHVIRTSDGGSTWGVVEVPDRLMRFWLSGVGLHRNSSGEVCGLMVGQEGVFGHLTDGVISWIP